MVKMLRDIMMVVAVSIPLRAADVSGEWTVKASFSSASVAKGSERHADLVCAFEQKNDTLRGSCRPVNGPAGVQVAGKVEGRQIIWHFGIALEPHGEQYTVTYAGTLNTTESIKGRFSIADRHGTFTAKKQRR